MLYYPYIYIKVNSIVYHSILILQIWKKIVYTYWDLWLAQYVLCVSAFHFIAIYRQFIDGDEPAQEGTGTARPEVQFAW